MQHVVCAHARAQRDVDSRASTAFVQTTTQKAKRGELLATKRPRLQSFSVSLPICALEEVDVKVSAIVVESVSSPTSTELK